MSLVAMKDPSDRSHNDLSLVNVNGESHNRLLSKDNNVISKAFDTMVKVIYSFFISVYGRGMIFDNTNVI